MARGSNIPLKYVPLSVSYNGFAQTEAATYGLGLSLVAGTRASFGYGSDSAAYDNKRYKASPSFLVLKGDANATYTLGSGAQLHGRLSGQLADAALVSGEQMAAGGANSVRGYLSAEATGDYGISGTVEWRTPQLTYFSRLENWRLFAFADGARLRLRDLRLTVGIGAVCLHDRLQLALLTAELCEHRGVGIIRGVGQLALQFAVPVFNLSQLFEHGGIRACGPHHGGHAARRRTLGAVCHRAARGAGAGALAAAADRVPPGAGVPASEIYPVTTAKNREGRACRG